MKNLILNSPTTSKNVSQSSIFYLAAFLSKMDVEIEDLSGMIDFYNPPIELFENQEILWQSPLIFDECWIDSYIPKIREKEYDYIYVSALFSMDIILQGRYVKKYKERNPRVKTKIGGQAVKNLNNAQLEVIMSVFDEVFVGDLYIRPDYNLYDLKKFVTVATGTGCDWGKCKFCVSGQEKYSLKNLDKIVAEILCISNISDSEVMLSSDSIPIVKINELSLKLINSGNKQKYNLMMRADKKIDKIFSKNLKMSGCSDVFIGGEILDDKGLFLINKGTTVSLINESIKNLNDAGIDIQIGLILFLPHIAEYQLENQLYNLEKLLPYINKIEPESLSVIYNSDFYRNSSSYGINLYPEKNPIFSKWCYGMSPDISWGFKNDKDYFVWEKHIDLLRQMIGSYVDEEYWWHVDYIKENWK